MPDNLLTKFKNFYKSMTEEKAITKEPGEQNIKDDTLISADIYTKEPEIGKTKNDGKKEHTPEEVKEEVIKVLKTCYDPEIPVDVWELGLIYDIKIATNGDVLVIMTLTSPSCPVAGILPGEIEQKIKDHPMVNDCKVQLTFDPPWSQKMMSEVAKLELGFL